VQPVFEGWERNGDGSFTMVFGYMNRNYEEQPEIPVGPGNNIEPGGPDQNQPTYFYPRRQMFVFKVRVPPDWGEQRLTWTLTLHGRTDKANAWLNPEYELTDLVYAENRGRSGEGTDGRVNEPPKISVADHATRTIVLGDTVTLTALASDDGLPAPSPRRTARSTPVVAVPSPNPDYVANSPVGQAVVKPNPAGLSVTWVHYRGHGEVTFSPPRQLVKDGKATTIATIREAGTHVLRTYADDGVLTTPADVTVIVNPGHAVR
jgi:hypothetical protein